MSATSTLITPDLQALIGTRMTGDPEYVERNDIRYFAEAARWPEDPKPLYSDEVYARKSRFGGLIAPPSYFSRLARRRGYSLPLPLPQWLRARPGVSASASIERELPIRAGDTIFTQARVVDIAERSGAQGRLVDIVREFSFTNQLDEHVGRARRTTVRFMDSLPHNPHDEVQQIEGGGGTGAGEIPPFSREVGLMELNVFAGANREWGQYHMDRDFARSLGLRDVLVLESLKMAYVASMLEDWIGEDGWIQKVDLAYPGLDHVGDTLTARGRVDRRYVQDAGEYADCSVWIENQDGKQGTMGTATVRFG